MKKALLGFVIVLGLGSLVGLFVFRSLIREWVWLKQQPAIPPTAYPKLLSTETIPNSLAVLTTLTLGIINGEERALALTPFMLKLRTAGEQSADRLQLP